MGRPLSGSPLGKTGPLSGNVRSHQFRGQIQWIRTLQFEDLMFPVLEMRTNVKHDANGDRAGTQLLINQQLQKIEGGDKRYGFAVSVSSDNQASVNPPYSFMVEAYAIIHAMDSTLDAEAEAKQVQANGLSHHHGRHPRTRVGNDGARPLGPVPDQPHAADRADSDHLHLNARCRA